MNPHLPHDSAEIHPFMPRSLHVPTPSAERLCNMSPLGERVISLGVSIHDRPAVEAIYNQMRQEELLPRK